MTTTHAVVKVYPYPLTNLSVTDGTSTITIGNGITDSGSYYSFDIGTGYTLGCTDLTFSTDNYLSFEIYCGTDTVHEITMVKTMYAWGIQSGGTITGPYVYTFSETPTSGDKVFEYNNNVFEEYGTVYTFSNNVLGFRYWAGKSDDYYRASSEDVSVEEPSSEPLALLDGNGNVYVLNGSVLVVGAPEPELYTLSFTIYGSLVDAPTVTITHSGQTESVSNGDTIDVSGECTITAQSSDYKHIKLDDVRVTSGYTNPLSYTYTPSADGEFTIYTDNR